MNLVVLSVVLAATAAAPEAEVTLLNGEPQRGRLTQISSTAVVLSRGDERIQVPLSNTMRLVLTGNGAREAAAKPARPVATLVDGSRFGFTDVRGSAREMTFETSSLGRIALPPSAVASLRLSSSGADVEDRWRELCERETTHDLLVVRKGDVLDHIAGLVGTIGEKDLRFLLDGEEIPLPRDKVFGVVYSRRPPAAGKPAGVVKLRDGDVLQAARVELDGGMLTTEGLTGARVVVPVETVRSIDFSFGKVQYLSDMEPRDVKYTPYFDVTWEYRRDTNLDGGPLRLGNQTFARGLAIHSQTYLRYRIGGEFRRFQAVMGIDAVVADKGNVHVVIQGDGKTLLEADVLGTDQPRAIDLDVSNVRDLEIRVEFGGDLDIADHLDLADARVIK